MKKFAFVLAALAAGASCGQTSGDASQGTTTTTAPTTTTTTTASMVTETSTTSTGPTTTTTTCTAVDTASEEAYLDALRASIRQTEGAIAQIQLVIDNGTRDRAAALRYQASVQTDYNKASAAFLALPSDDNHDRMAVLGDRLANAQDTVASWDALLTKARGDLSRAQAQKADFDRKSKDIAAQIAAAPSC